MTSPPTSGPFDITAVDLLSQSQDATIVQVQVPGIPQTGNDPDHTLQIAGIVGGTGLVLVGVAAIRRRRPAAA
ncbi:MAG: LPXTG cell wall anchor domain-containing protein [Ilumatobacteraceae bacterium]